MNTVFIPSYPDYIYMYIYRSFPFSLLCRWNLLYRKYQRYTYIYIYPHPSFQGWTENKFGGRRYDILKFGYLLCMDLDLLLIKPLPSEKEEEKKKGTLTLLTDLLTY